VTFNEVFPNTMQFTVYNWLMLIASNKTTVTFSLASSVNQS